MDDKNGFRITNRDHVLGAWQNSTDLVRDFQAFSHEIKDEDEELSRLFAEFAEDEAVHAAKLHDLRKNYE